MNKRKEAQKVANLGSVLINQGLISFEDIYNQIMNQNKRQTAFIHHEAEGQIRNYTYEQYDRLSVSVARKLSVLLIEHREKNKIVGIKIRNSPAWCFIFWGVLMSGYRPLLIDVKLAKENTQNLLNASGAIAIITDDSYTYNNVITLKRHDINDISEDLNFVPSWADEVIFCSSGTTGDIKLVIYNGENMVRQVDASKDMPRENVNIIYPQRRHNPLRIIALLPLHHIFGFIAVFLWYSCYNSTIIFTDFVDPINIIKDIRELKITHIYHVPLFYEVIIKNFMNRLTDKEKNTVNRLIKYNLGEERGLLLKMKIIENKIKNKIFGNQVRYLISGGGALETNVSETINGLGYPLYNGYGMTEIGVTSVELSTRLLTRIKTSIGHPLHNVEYMIGKKDELLVKSKITHIKEIINGKEVKTKLNVNGFFATGDITRIDENGKYYLRGRLKEVIITSNGENIYPDEIEANFKNIKGVNNVAVFGINKKIILVVESTKDIAADINDINKTLPLHKQVNEIIYTKDPLPLSSSMKVKRYLVKENYNNGKYKVSSKTKMKKVDILAGYDENNRNNVVKHLETIFQTILYTEEKINGNAHWIDDLKSDSMTYVSLIAEIEKEFAVTIPLEKYGKLTTLNEFAKELLDSGCK